MNKRAPPLTTDAGPIPRRAHWVDGSSARKEVVHILESLPLHAPHQHAKRILVVVNSLRGVDDLVASLRTFGILTLVAFGAGRGRQIIEDDPPAALIILGAVRDCGELVDAASTRHVPIVLAGDCPGTERLDGEALAIVVPTPSTPDVIARSAATVMPREQRQDPEEFTAGPLRINPAKRRAYYFDRPLDLPPTEFTLLLELAHRRGRPVSSRELAKAVWPNSEAVTAGDVHRHVYRLRSALGDRSRKSKLVIINRRGYGYVLNV